MKKGQAVELRGNYPEPGEPLPRDARVIFSLKAHHRIEIYQEGDALTIRSIEGGGLEIFPEASNTVKVRTHRW